MSFLRRHIVLVFFALTYLISWGIWLGVAATGRPLTGLTGLVALLGAFGPSLAGVICAGLAGGADGLRAWLARLVDFRIPPRLVVTVLLIPVAVALVPVLLNSLRSGPSPDWQGLAQWPLLLPVFARMLLIGGLTEEPGWRGFALPALYRSRGPLQASLILGVAWGLWHLPIYTLPQLGSPLGPGQLILFLLGTLPLTVLFTAFAERAHGSVVIAILFHAWSNTVIPSLAGLLDVPTTGQLGAFQLVVMGLLCLPIIQSWRRRAYESQPEPAAAPGE
jgi:membrane protease YdiL (CAAX protease family)